ncbi:hypothetical protein EDD63_10767 [Breznakia blatticola]|uniref:Uncharacterized protein n=1 Tax=Breznakia blatticola TaxID=1754012 RepID=A0A4R8A3Q5_9FIRM|nr:hypothetical protein [Breznakia blatticola]TDW24915.1 hypothetical protein EDD63_10767 [Breznakia blatticola]
MDIQKLRSARTWYNVMMFALSYVVFYDLKINVFLSSVFFTYSFVLIWVHDYFVRNVNKEKHFLLYKRINYICGILLCGFYLYFCLPHGWVIPMFMIIVTCSFLAFTYYAIEGI